MYKKNADIINKTYETTLNIYYSVAKLAHSVNYIINLQWTTTGGSSSALAAAEFLMKLMRGSACRGTPWSGQAV